MTIVGIATKGRGQTGNRQWVTLYRLATFVNGKTINHKGPLDNGLVSMFVRTEMYITQICKLCINEVMTIPMLLLR